MIKLFVSDMDGTLLNERHIIADETADAIRELQAAGIEFMIATGRSYSSAKPLLDSHKIEAQIIGLNGAAVYDVDGNLLSSVPIDRDVYKEITQYCEERDLEYFMVNKEGFYVSDREAFIEETIELLKGVLEDYTKENNNISEVQLIEEAQTIKNLKEYPLVNGNPPLKVMLYSQDPEELIQFNERFSTYEDLDITSSAPDNLEITHTNAQKGLAVEAYALSQGYTMNDVATIGDSLNDRSMLKMAKYSFAMENASDEVKKLANYSAPSNRLHGVAQIIRNFLDGKIQ